MGNCMRLNSGQQVGLLPSEPSWSDFNVDCVKPETGLEADHWFEIELNNGFLFENLKLRHVPNLLPGRIFTTRMPRNIATDISAQRAFEEKCAKHRLSTVVILTEYGEYEKYAKANIESFYAKIGLDCLVQPIEDFNIPSVKDFSRIINEITLKLAGGENCLVHCAGGNGRTGLVVCGVLKNCGVKNPIKKARQVKSTYVETKGQENMIRELPVTLTKELFLRHPTLAKVVAVDRLISAASNTKQDSRRTSLFTSDKEEKAAVIIQNLFRNGRHHNESINSDHLSPFAFFFQSQDEGNSFLKNSTCAHGRPQNGYLCRECPGAGICREHREVLHRCKKCKQRLDSISEKGRKLANDRVSLAALSEEQEEEIRTVFRLLDAKGDRRISMNELNNVFVGMGEPIDKRVLEKIMNSFGSTESMSNTPKPRSTGNSESTLGKMTIKRPSGLRQDKKKAIYFDDFAAAMSRCL